MAGSGDSTRAILFALGANLAIACAKGVAAYFTRSSAMLAETVHSLADCGNPLLLLFGMRQARRPVGPPSFRRSTGTATQVARYWMTTVTLLIPTSWR